MKQGMLLCYYAILLLMQFYAKEARTDRSGLPCCSWACSCCSGTCLQMADASELFAQGCDELEQAIAELAEWADAEMTGTEDSTSRQRALSLRDRLADSLGKFTSMKDRTPGPANESREVQFSNFANPLGNKGGLEEHRDNLSPTAAAAGGSLFVSEAGKLQRLKSAKAQAS